jgi:non-ribosomal peptide synthetase component F/acyl carrier protein
MINQQGMLNHLYAKIEDLQLQPQDCVAQNASSNFDISVWQMWAALLQGGRVHLFSAEEAQQPHQLWRCVREQAITVLQVVPSFLRLLLDELQGKETNVFDPWMHLRLLLATGEALPADLCRRWLQRLPEVPLINAYGPTECSDDVTHAWLKSDSTGFLERVPIGRPLRNTQLYVLDRQMELVPVGVVGELYVGGKGVGRGYLGVPEQTGASFVPDPWSQEPGARLYRTGDLVRYWEDGKLEHIGRVDEQVKLRGYRIELGEIEATLRGLPAIEDAVVLVRDDVADDECLVAYVVGGKHGEMLDEDAIYRELQATLPGYMVPRYLVLLTALPVTTNGKIDRQSLPVPKRRLGESTEQGMVACTPIEEIVLGVYRDVLGVERIGLHENFFHLGGHSLLATQVIARLRGHMHIEIPLRSLFEAPSVAGLAQRIESMLRREEARSLPPLVPISREQDIPLSFAQERLWFLQQLEPDSSAYQVSIAFRLSGPLSVEVFSRCLQTMVQRHESLRTTFVMGLERPIQVINAHLHVNVPVIDLQEVTEDKQSLAVSQWIRDARHHPFDLESGPLMRVSLFHIGKDEYVFSVVMPHIVMDEWAASVFLREFPLMYEAMLQDKPAPLAPLKFQYADFAFWQRNWLQGETLKALIEYWTEQLRGAVPLELPTDRARTQAVSNRGAMYSFKLRKQLVQILRAFSRQEGVTLFMTLLNALLIVLYHSTGQQDLVVGTDIADRRMRETEDMIGFFINLLVVRLRLSVQATFRETLKSLCSVMLDSYAHQDLPFEKLVEELQLNREPGHVPLVNVLFVFENVPPRTFELPGLMVSQVETNSLVNAAKFDVALFLVEEGQELLGSVNYRTDLFEPGTIERLVHHFEVLLQDSMANPDIPLEMLEMLTTEEKDQRMHESNIYMQKQRNRLKSAKRRVVALSTDGEKS